MRSSDGSLEAFLAAQHQQRLAGDLQRERISVEALSGVHLNIGETSLTSFCSNDYLGLASDPRLVRAAAKAGESFAAGSGASALISGYSHIHRDLEAGIAAFLEREAALVFPSGYQANLAVIGSLAGKSDHVVQDRLCHASLIDGARLSGARLLRYPHSDMDGLQRQLSRPCQGQRVVVTDGVFSMDGDVARLRDMASLCQSHGAWLMVDDAHGFGVEGPGGQGSVIAANLTQNDVPVLTGTLGKAAGVGGAFVAGSRALIEHIVNHGRGYLFTTALSPMLAAAASRSLELIEEESWRREQLRRNIEHFCSGARDLGLELLPGDGPIQPIVIGEAGRAMHMSARLKDIGFWVPAIRPPTVPEQSSRLRITLSAAHDQQQVTDLLGALEHCS